MNFAGILAVRSVVEIGSEAIRRVLDVNVLGTVRVNQALFPLVLARKGCIVNISSETGWQSGMPLLAEVVHRALTSRHPRPAYSVKPDVQRAAICLLPARLADPLLKLAFRLLS